ncbi:reverse transcriptase domain-containing protein [Tanacetum coccineum]
MDGSSCVDRSGAGLILTSLEGTEFTYALRFQFTASNNEGEYEALIDGLRIATQIGVRNVHVGVDSKLVANQVLVPRSKNKKADTLSKIASTSFAHLSKQVLVEILKEKSIQEKEVATVVEEEGPTWITAKSLGPSDRQYTYRDIVKDPYARIKFCQTALVHHPIDVKNLSEETDIFYILSLEYKWLGGTERGGNMGDDEGEREAMDTQGYMKWWRIKACTEVLVMSAGDGNFWRNEDLLLMEGVSMLSRLGWLVEGGDIGLMSSLHRGYMTQVKMYACQNKIGGSKSHTDRILLANNACGCKKDDKGMSRLPCSPPRVKKPATKLTPIMSLWPFYKWGIDIACPFPEGPGNVKFFIHNDEELRLNLDLLEERRERAAIREAKAKLKMTKYYNARVRGVTFRPEDSVYRHNDASRAVDGRKLGPKWEGPYEVTEALGDGAYRLRSMDGTVLPWTWNIANLKKCYL